MRMNRGIIVATIAALCFLQSSSVRAELIVEDFDNGSFGGFSSNPLFNHTIDIDVIAGGPVGWEFADTTAISGPFSLHLFPGGDFITFNLGEGEFIDYAEVWMRGLKLLPTSFHVLGEDMAGQPLHVVYNTAFDDIWTFASTEGAGFSIITEVWLSSMKDAFYDDLAVNVVPEPATMGLLGLGFASLFVRRRRR